MNLRKIEEFVLYVPSHDKQKILDKAREKRKANMDVLLRTYRRLERDAEKDN